MRYSVLGFNQEKLLQYDISMNEILLLSYIYEAQASPKMEHIIENGKTYTWFSHTKIQEDLPILNVSETQLKRYIKHLIDSGLIESTKIANNLLRGTKSYYGITNACEELKYCTDDQVSKMTLENTQESRPSVKNDTSYSKLSYKSNVLSKDNTFHNSELIKTKKPKQSLWDKCIVMINEFTEDEILRGYLVEFLKKCLENSKEANVPFYSNTFKGKLNALKRLSDDNYVQREIVLQTLDNGWNGFYALKKDKQNLHDRIHESGAGENIPKGDKQALKESIRNGTAEKF